MNCKDRRVLWVMGGVHVAFQWAHPGLLLSLHIQHNTDRQFTVTSFLIHTYIVHL